MWGKICVLAVTPRAAAQTCGGFLNGVEGMIESPKRCTSRSDLGAVPHGLFGPASFVLPEGVRQISSPTSADQRLQISAERRAAIFALRPEPAGRPAALPASQTNFLRGEAPLVFRAYILANRIFRLLFGVFVLGLALSGLRVHSCTSTAASCAEGVVQNCRP